MGPEWAADKADGSSIVVHMGDSGFVIGRLDGTEGRFYVEPPDGVTAGLSYSDLETPDDTENDLGYYIEVLAELVSEAGDTFGDSGSPGG